MNIKLIPNIEEDKDIVTITFEQFKHFMDAVFIYTGRNKPHSDDVDVTREIFDMMKEFSL